MAHYSCFDEIDFKNVSDTFFGFDKNWWQCSKMNSEVDFDNVTVSNFDNAFNLDNSKNGYFMSIKNKSSESKNDDKFLIACHGENYLDKKIHFKESDAQYLIPLGFDSKQDLSFKDVIVGKTISVKTRLSRQYWGCFDFIEFIKIL